jgi:hypothetical protein
MSYIQNIQTKIQVVTEQKTELDAEIQKLEEEFANVKLNPYGITSIDFSKRQEKTADSLKMEGVLMGLQLAIDTYEELQSVAG